MYFQPSSSPNICSQLDTSRKPVPDEFGLGITIMPLYSGLVRSFQEVGAFTPAFSASTVLKQIAAIQASMPVHCGGLEESTNFGSSASTPLGA
jgi:hypothetical protein